MQYGRRPIFTAEPEITAANLIPVLREALVDFMPNSEDCTFLLKYEKGEQPKIRKKLYRTEIDYWTVENIANEITEFKIDYNWGNPITLIQRGEKDSGTANEPDAIAILNEYYDAEEIKKKTQELARFVEITGIGYTIVDINSEWEEGDSPFTVNVLDPRFAFVVRSSYYPDHRVMLGVTFRRDKLGNYFFTCYTKHEQFEVLNTIKILNGDKEDNVDIWRQTARSGEENPLHRIPIIEWFRDYDRMGCFERQIPEMNHLNLMVSDLANDIDQNTQAIWHGNDLEFPTDEAGNQLSPESGQWLITQTTPDGKTPFINPLKMDYDYSGMLDQITYKVNRIKEKCNVPLRSEASNSTGIAVSDSSGWSNAELEANRQDQIKYGCKLEELKCVLAAIRETALARVDDKLLKLRAMDIAPSIRRQKNYEMSVKTTALANLLSHGIYGLHALNTVNLFEDVNQVWEDSRELIEKYQESTFNKSEQTTSEAQTTDGGYEAQIGNSPSIDGMSKEQPETAEE